MEKFKQLLEEAQKLTENDNGVLRNVKLIPTPDDVVRGVGKLLSKPFQKGNTQQSQQNQQAPVAQQPQTTRVDKKNRGTILYFKMTDNSLPNPLFIRYNKMNNDVQFIDEVDFKRMS